MQNIANQIIQARTTGKWLSNLSPPPINMNEALQVQRLVFNHIEHKQTHTTQTRVFKVANTNTSSQQYLQRFEPFWGQLPTSHVFYSSSSSKKIRPTINVSLCNVGLVEMEYALRVGPNGVDPDAIIPSVEIVHSSFTDWRSQLVPSLVADLACNFCLILGSPILLVHTRQLITNLPHCTLTSSSSAHSQVLTTGHPCNVMGDPMNVYRWFSKQIQLRPGDIISTGVSSNPPYHHCTTSEVLTADYGALLGKVEFGTNIL